MCILGLIFFSNAVLCSGAQGSIQNQDEHRQVSSCDHGAHSQTRPALSAGVQCAEWHCGCSHEKIRSVWCFTAAAADRVCFVQICSLMRGGIAERGGVRVGHRIIEINGQSVVATPHEKIVHILSNAVGEVNHHRSQLTLSPPNTDFSVISLLYTRGRYYTSLNESRKCRSKTQTRKTQKRAMSYVWKTMWSSTLTAYKWKLPNVTEWNVNPESGKGQCKLWEYWWKPSTASLLW